MDITLRKAKTYDLDAVVAIEREGSNRWKPDFFKNELETPFSVFIVAEAKDEVAGFAIAWNIPGEIQLNNIAVRKHLRRSGIGTILYRGILDYLKDREPKRIYLETQSRNRGAISFYQRLGFTVNGLRKDYYTDDDAVLLEMDLTDDDFSRK